MPLRVQAFGNGFGPFLEHIQDEDFLHAVSKLVPSACQLAKHDKTMSELKPLAPELPLAFLGLRTGNAVVWAMAILLLDWKLFAFSSST